jgi:hypothetical protein
MSEPTYTCALCGSRQTVDPFARGFPPDAAKRKLIKRCNAAGCACDPRYRAGMDPTLERFLLASEERPT